ncbi:hypothetical protein HCDG_04413 [Histoplasma capsulatum H143]|uniref:Uncharacterized protein n=1 Tax=Ajellomyces capsulatus (strain H143) TaxID=544712 RepID=C6HDY2_AJECH|nr:hypothetical protein HCDG_04413 [Histoplasma capsulatum H143]
MAGFLHKVFQQRSLASYKLPLTEKNNVYRGILRRGSIDGATCVDEARVFCGDLIAQRASETNRGSCTGSSGIIRTPKLNCMHRCSQYGELILEYSVAWVVVKQT